MKKGNRILLILTLAITSLVLLLTGCAKEKAYPSQDITVVVPVKAGGDTDSYARIFSQYLEKELGVSVTVKNVDGASGTIGSREVYNAKNDGYTALFFHGTSLLSEIVGLTDLELLDYTIISVPVADQTATLVAPAKRFKDYNDFVTKTKAGEKIIASIAQGSYAQLACVLFDDSINGNFTYVDSTSAADRIADMLGGRIDLFFSQYGLMKQYIDNGDFISLGVMSDERNPFFPDVPTFKEQGSDISMDKLFYFAFPPNTDSKIVEAFSAALQKAIQDPACIADFAKFFVQPKYLSPEQSTTLLKDSKAVYQKFEKQLIGE
ncbi:MAG: tripartite tricarboxylate transporter substrate binding protein [Candidatus Pacebacteria bacterium]|nr:tripartite tricarboxylate transporter substrate binding protein [Candidatus Paceibacterota bacterium]